MHKVVQISLRFELPCSKNGVGTLEIGILASHAKVDQASLTKASPGFKLVGPIKNNQISRSQSSLKTFEMPRGHIQRVSPKFQK